MPKYDPPTLTFPWGIRAPSNTGVHGSLGSQNPRLPQTASWLAQLFLQRRWLWPTDRQDMLHLCCAARLCYNCDYRPRLCCAQGRSLVITAQNNKNNNSHHLTAIIQVISVGWLGSRVVSVLDSGAEGPKFQSQSRSYRVTILGKLFTPIVPLFTKQQNW